MIYEDPPLIPGVEPRLLLTVEEAVNAMSTADKARHEAAIHEAGAEAALRYARNEACVAREAYEEATRDLKRAIRHAWRSGRDV
mgnify:CR=1 FL=1